MPRVGGVLLDDEDEVARVGVGVARRRLRRLGEVALLAIGL